jgi:Zn-dependent protease/CBS domain-containing protein
MRFRWTWKLGRIAGIQVAVHPSWLIIYALFAWSATTLARAISPELNAASTAVLGLIASLIIFASVVAHEFAHALVARRLGIPIGGITLFLFGGVATILREPALPLDEMRMAAAGPLLSFVLAIVFGALAVAAGALHLAWPYTLCFFLAFANGVLAIFNLLPAFPSDGGRILRAALWMAQRSQARATGIASRISFVVALGLAAAGLYFVFSMHTVRGVWWIVIATFLAQAAITSAQRANVDLILESMTVRECMLHVLIAVPASTSVATFIGEVAGAPGAAYPVLSEGALVGLADVRQTAGLPLALWNQTPISAVMTPIANAAALRPDANAREALGKLHDLNLNELPVLENGELIGIVSQELIFRALHERRKARSLRA